jgi:hypothetical protein
MTSCLHHRANIRKTVYILSLFRNLDLAAIGDSSYCIGPQSLWFRTASLETLGSGEGRVRVSHITATLNVFLWSMDCGL